MVRSKTSRTSRGEGADLDDGIALRATDVEKSYGSVLPFTRTVDVLTGASLEVPEGAIVGIVGENGSGKSTLMKILVGALEKDAGTVRYSGAIGWCPQETLLYDKLTVEETFRLFGEGYGMSHGEIDAAIERLTTQLDFERFLDYRIDQLSGGNQQKVNLSVSLMHDPDVVLLDEPYTGFDWETYLAFWELTEGLTERGTSIVIISHLVEEKKRFDRIYQLRDGLVQEET